MNRRDLIQRLSYIKLLYQIGVKQSHQHESIAIFSVLSFHDSIEMFLKLLAEHKGVNSNNFNFLQYWESISDLSLKESMRALNARRVNLKHRGIHPGKADIETSRINTTDFFEQNTMTQFGVEFKDISLIELVGYDKVKSYLLASQSFLDEGNVEESIKNSACAFNELLHTYEDNKSTWGKRPFTFGSNMSFLSSFHIGLSLDDERETRKMNQFIDKVKESIEGLQDAVKITSLGIDYKEYIKFDVLTPVVSRTIGGDLVAEIYGKKKWTTENCQFCIDFVVNSALKLQEFDFDIESLEVQPNQVII